MPAYLFAAMVARPLIAAAGVQRVGVPLPTRTAAELARVCHNDRNRLGQGFGCLVQCVYPPHRRGDTRAELDVTQPDEELASPEQMQELRSLAGPDEDIPEGMRASEAKQRIVELKSAD